MPAGVCHYSSPGPAQQQRGQPLAPVTALLQLLPAALCCPALLQQQPAGADARHAHPHRCHLCCHTTQQLLINGVWPSHCMHGGVGSADDRWCADPHKKLDNKQLLPCTCHYQHSRTSTCAAVSLVTHHLPMNTCWCCWSTAKTCARGWRPSEMPKGFCRCGSRTSADASSCTAYPARAAAAAAPASIPAAVTGAEAAAASASAAAAAARAPSSWGHSLTRPSPPAVTRSCAWP